jgi:hypothetical protein
MNKTSICLALIIPLLIYIFTCVLFCLFQPVCIQKIPITNKEEDEFAPLLTKVAMDWSKLFSYSTIPVVASILLFTVMI